VVGAPLGQDSAVDNGRGGVEELAGVVRAKLSGYPNAKVWAGLWGRRWIRRCPGADAEKGGGVCGEASGYSLSSPATNAAAAC